MKRPTHQTLAAALGVGRTRLREFISWGCPTDTIDDAIAWHQRYVDKPVTESPDGAPESYSEARRRYAVASANLAEMKAKQRDGELILREPAERAAFQMWRMVSRQLTDVFPSEVAASLANLPAGEAEKRLRDHIRDTLTRLSKMEPEQVMQA